MNRRQFACALLGLCLGSGMTAFPLSAQATEGNPDKTGVAPTILTLLAEQLR